MEPLRPSMGPRHRGSKRHKSPDGQRRLFIEADNGITAATTKSNIELRVPGTKDDFVRRWLVQTGHEALGGIYNSTKDTKKYREKLPVESMSRHNALYEDEDFRIKKRRKRQWHSSSDSSLLDSVVDSRIRNDASQKYEKRDQTLSRLQVKRKDETLDTEMPERSSNHQETFERRPRRKTREDLYEPKDQKRDSELPSREKRTKRVKKGDRKRTARRAGEDLMRNFSSEKISHDRLTLLPSHGLGLFNNGRTSSPQGRRGLPDLASSEMMFLQRPTRAPANEPDKCGSKSREKERRRVEREQVEISTFFKPRGEPNIVRCSRETSRHISDEQPTSMKQISDRYGKRHLSLQISDRDVTPGQRSQFSGTYCTPRSFSHPNRLPRQEPDGTTCVTWSETQMTPEVTSSLRRRNIGQPQVSPIPDSIRRSLEETGIFRDTGIESTTALNPSRETKSLETRTGGRVSSTPSNRNRLLVTDKNTTLLSESHGQRSVLRKERKSYPEDSQREKDLPHRTHEEHLCSKERPQGERPPPSPVRSTPPPAALSCSQNPHDSTCPPMTREQLAQKARIRRQPGTLPVSAKVGMPPNENEVQVINPNSLDGQEKVGTSNTNDSTPTECTTTLSKAVETVNRSRVEETAHHLQETAGQDIPITQPGPPMAQLPVTSIEEAFNTGCIMDENSARLDQTNQVQAPFIAANCATTPIQGSFVNWITRTTSQPLPIAEYLHDDPVQFHYTEHIPYELDNIGEQYGFPFEDENIQVPTYLEHTKYDLWEDEYATLAMQDLDFVYDGTTGLEWPVQSIIPQSLEGQEQFTYQEMGDSELWFGDLTDPQIPGDILSRSNELYWADTGYEQANEADDTLRGFWRPHRTY